MLPGQTFVGGVGVTGTPDPETAGTAFTATVYAVDDQFNVVTTAPGIVSITTTDPFDVEPSSGIFVSGTIDFEIVPQTASASGWTITTSGGPGTGSTSSAYPVVAGPAAATIVVLPGQTLIAGSGITGTPLSHLAGSAMSVTVDAVDAYGNVVPSATETVSLTDADPGATVDAPIGLVNGSIMFGIAGQTAGYWHLTPAGGPGTQTESSPFYVSGAITTVAGDGTGGDGGDGGPATAANIGLPFSVANDGAGGYYVSSTSAGTVRHIDATGTITTFAGGGTRCSGATSLVGDGCAATDASLSGLLGLATDGGHRLYIADEFHHRSAWSTRRRASSPRSPATVRPATPVTADRLRQRS